MNVRVKFRSYQYLQRRDPNMRARSRNFRTSGVILCIDHKWFKNAIVKQTVQRQIAGGLRAGI